MASRSPLSNRTNGQVYTHVYINETPKRSASIKAADGIARVSSLAASGQVKRGSPSTTRAPFTKPPRKKGRLSNGLQKALKTSITEEDVSIYIQRVYKIAQENIRPFQTATAVSVYDGRSTFVVAGTGAGKTIAYSALLLKDDAVLLVLCPLSRLMQEQVRHLFFFFSCDAHARCVVMGCMTNTTI